ncbi:TonB-dependent receptor [Flavobacterium sp.]|uniref:TonB-dependent receptor plug domain-containing protein n=1 Tax=Flavobacterium sp. TaxID=239 RepID=UPI00260226B6|nr:TonB-dependent receptor [Flavobacterium sp.]
MKYKALLACLYLLAYAHVSCAQEAVALQEVVLTDTALRDFSNTHVVSSLADSLPRFANPFLAQILSANSLLYVKENGAGMVASVAFRGTTAAQTAVIWNGIPINSVLLGQVDFNTIQTANYQDISVRSGGGSTFYGSGAIGGSVHLENNFDLSKSSAHQIRYAYGSYNNHNAFAESRIRRGRWILAGSFFLNDAENDYEFPNRRRRNSNGDYQVYSLNFRALRKLTEHSELRFFNEYVQQYRNFSLVFPTDVKTAYTDLNYRHSAEFVNRRNRVEHLIRLGFLREVYQYDSNRSLPDYQSAYAATALARYEFKYQLTKKLRFTTIADAQRIFANGADINRQQRTTFTTALGAAWQPYKSDLIELGLRKEQVSDFESPFLFSLGYKHAFAEELAVRMGVSRNFRAPTFNDLYWNTLGNPNLRAENAWQYELGLQFAKKDWNLSLTAFQNQVNDMIRWVPGASGQFRPENTDEVDITGIELQGDYHFKFGNNLISLSSSYAYTKSINTKTDLQLVYVPEHKAVFNLKYSYKSLEILYNQQWVSAVETRSDHSGGALDAFSTASLYLNYNFSNFPMIVSFAAQNLYNTAFQTVLNRPMPLRTYQINLTLNL